MRPSRLIAWSAALYASVMLLWTPTRLDAVEKTKAVYIGGTLPGFPQGDRTSSGFNVEGRVDTQADAQFVFDAGTRGTITIPYDAIGSLTFGRIEPFGSYDAREKRGARVYPRDFYSKDHFLLTIVYQDQSNTEQVVVLWLGYEIVRPTLATLEERTGKVMEFADAQGCAQYKTREECGYAGAGALKGIKRVFVDTGEDTRNRDVIVSEIQKAKLDLEVSDKAGDADVILDFRAFQAAFARTSAGIGEILVRVDQDDRLRLASEFAESGRSPKALATQFARTFLDAYKKDNQLR